MLFVTIGKFFVKVARTIIKVCISFIHNLPSLFDRIFFNSVK